MQHARVRSMQRKSAGRPKRRGRAARDGGTSRRSGNAEPAAGAHEVPRRRWRAFRGRQRVCCGQPASECGVMAACALQSVHRWRPWLARPRSPSEPPREAPCGAARGEECVRARGARGAKVCHTILLASCEVKSASEAPRMLMRRTCLRARAISWMHASVGALRVLRSPWDAHPRGSGAASQTGRAASRARRHGSGRSARRRRRTHARISRPLRPRRRRRRERAVHPPLHPLPAAAARLR